MAQKKSRPIRTRNGIPLTRDEYRQLKRQKEREDRRKRQEAWEAARGPLDMPFLLLAERSMMSPMPSSIIDRKSVV